VIDGPAMSGVDAYSTTRHFRKRFCAGPKLAVRPEGVNYQWRRNPPRKLSIDLVADERLGRVTGRAGAS